MINDTIVALSTAPLTSAIGVIRMSGENSFDILSKLMNKKLKDFKVRNSIVGKIYDNESNIVDEVVCILYKHPTSFTGEDVVEINCHGGLLIINKIISLCIGYGARMAEHGEFSKKAFYNGKIDLVQAESINDLIMSKTDLSSKLALQGLKGNTSTKLREFKNKLVELLAQISVNIDYPEYEDIEQLNNEIILPILNSLLDSTKNLVNSSNKGRFIRDGIKTAIVGKPNAGKSSILNCLLGEEKAIVTDIAGTTRDVVEGHIVINGLPFELLDTAGIREAKDTIEQIGIKKSKEAVEKADLVIIVIDGSNSIIQQQKDLDEFKDLVKDNSIIVVNKSDKCSENIGTILVSAVKNDIKELKKEMVRKVGFNDFSFNDLAILSNSRQIGLISKAYYSMCSAVEAIKNNVETDLVAIDINEALDYINEILGEKTKEDLDNEIFSKFCIGK